MGILHGTETWPRTGRSDDSVTLRHPQLLETEHVSSRPHVSVHFCSQPIKSPPQGQQARRLHKTQAASSIRSNRCFDQRKILGTPATVVSDEPLNQTFEGCLPPILFYLSDLFADCQSFSELLRRNLGAAGPLRAAPTGSLNQPSRAPKSHHFRWIRLLLATQ